MTMQGNKHLWMLSQPLIARVASIEKVKCLWNIHALPPILCLAWVQVNLLYSIRCYANFWVMFFIILLSKSFSNFYCGASFEFLKTVLLLNLCKFKKTTSSFYCLFYLVWFSLLKIKNKNNAISCVLLCKILSLLLKKSHCCSSPSTMSILFLFSFISCQHFTGLAHCK